MLEHDWGDTVNTQLEDRDIQLYRRSAAGFFFL